MQTTGIVRHIDDLGRVVIPREIRIHLGIKEGDPLEIFLEGKAVCFVKKDVQPDACHLLDNLVSVISGSNIESESEILCKLNEVKNVLRRNRNE